jgi:hypothetical protein
MLQNDLTKPDNFKDFLKISMHTLLKEFQRFEISMNIF